MVKQFLYQAMSLCWTLDFVKKIMYTSCARSTQLSMQLLL